MNIWLDKELEFTPTCFTVFWEIPPAGDTCRPVTWDGQSMSIWGTQLTSRRADLTDRFSMISCGDCHGLRTMSLPGYQVRLPPGWQSAQGGARLGSKWKRGLGSPDCKQLYDTEVTSSKSMWSWKGKLAARLAWARKFWRVEDREWSRADTERPGGHSQASWVFSHHYIQSLSLSPRPSSLESYLWLLTLKISLSSILLTFYD